MNFDTSHKDELYSDLISNINEYKKLHEFIYSKNFMNYFLQIFKTDIDKEIYQLNLKDINNYLLDFNPLEIEKVYSKFDLNNNEVKRILFPRLDIGIGIKGYGIKTGGKGIHVDNPQRLISILFYLGGFQKIEGGEHRIWTKKNNKLEIDKIIQPKPNLLIASLQNNVSFHDVNPIKSMTGTRNAFYIAISANQKIWKKLENNNFNQMYNKNRSENKYNLIDKIKNILRIKI